MKNGQRGEGIVVVGGQWGDEGKGRIVDSLAADCDVIVRFQGGNNAGHSLHFSNLSLVLHVIPCGIVREGKIAVIGNGVVVDPTVLFEEIATLTSNGFRINPENLKISRHAHIILPLHKLIDRLREGSPLSHIGTTRRGIGPCYEDKIARFGIRAQDLLSGDILRAKWQRLFANRRGLADEAADFLPQALNFGAQLRPYLCDSGEVIDAYLREGRRVLFEGAQGALLDIDHGTYPFVTSSNCVAAEAAIGSGIGSKWLNEVLMVSKAYCTRVGEGPFFTEVQGDLGERIRKKGHEFGATTGRPRRCGWLDLAALKYAARVNGATSLILTKIDVLAGMGPIKIATSYECAGQRGLNFSQALERFEEGYEITPHYEEFAPVMSMPNQIKSLADFPSSFRAMFELIEGHLGIPISMISFGQLRGQEITLRDFSTVSS